MHFDLQDLKLTLEQLTDIRDALHSRILDGLAAPNQEIRALPAFLRRPSRSLSGEAAALDVGGTNMRAARILLQGSKSRLLTRADDGEILQSAKIPGEVDAQQFFSRQAALLTQAGIRGTIDHLGYCFSYPMEIKPDGDAILLKWTKGLNIDGVVGTSARAGLLAALRERGIQAQEPPVLNDAVATLLAGATIGPDCTHYIGLIVGTGTNMAGYFPAGRIAKLAPEDRVGRNDDDEMAVDLESGDFAPPHLTEYDDMVDGFDPNDNPGTQRYEKAVSGGYLPRLFSYVIGSENCLKQGFDPDDPDTTPTSIARLQSVPGLVGESATAVLDRSADLVAASLAGLILAYGQTEQHVGILAEGPVFWETPGYSKRVKQTLDRLTGRGITTQIFRSREVNANFLGAASAALLTRADDQPTDESPRG